MTDELLRKLTDAAPNDVVIRIDGRAMMFVHDCKNDGNLVRCGIDRPLVFTPDGRRESVVRLNYGRCQCGAVIISSDTWET